MFLFAAGVDYKTRSDVRITWRAGEVDYSLRLPTDPPFEFEIMDDDIPEDREFFEIELTITRNALLYPVAVGRVTIIDDDGLCMFKYFQACCL